MVTTNRSAWSSHGYCPAPGCTASSAFGKRSANSAMVWGGAPRPASRPGAPALVDPKSPGHRIGWAYPDARPLRSSSSKAAPRSDRPSVVHHKRPGQRASDLVLSGAAFGTRTRDPHMTRATAIGVGGADLCRAVLFPRISAARHVAASRPGCLVPRHPLTQTAPRTAAVRSQHRGSRCFIRFPWPMREVRRFPLHPCP